MTQQAFDDTELPPDTRDVRIPRPDTRCACARARSPYTGRLPDERGARASRAWTRGEDLDDSPAQRALAQSLARLLYLWSDLVVEIPAWLAGRVNGDPDGDLFWLQTRLEDMRDAATHALVRTVAMQQQLEAEADARLEAAEARAGTRH